MQSRFSAGLNAGQNQTVFRAARSEKYRKLEVVADAPAEDVTEIFVMVRNAKVIGSFALVQHDSCNP